MTQRFTLGSAEPLGDNEVLAIISTGDQARDGHILTPAGCDLSGFRKNPIILWQHNPDQPVGQAVAVGVTGDNIAARIRFAPAGISPTADMVRGLVKSGVVTTMSIGFDVEDGEPLDPKNPRGGQRFTKWTLLEASFVSVPADIGAVVTARSFKARPGAAAMLRSLPMVAPDAVKRAADRIAASRPRALLTPNEQFEADRQRCLATWALGEAKRQEQDARYSYAARQADLRRLSRATLQ
jgi:HK97 family phage prohead protease